MGSGEIHARHFATGEPIHAVWRDGTIVEWQPSPKGADTGLWIAPGLVDLQINGYGGIDFQQDDLTIENLEHAARELRAAGCARFLLTLITDEWYRLTNRLSHIKRLRAGSAFLQQAIAGWHIEGPFLSPQPGYHGAHNPALMLAPTAGHVRELKKIVADDPLLLTLAPEVAGALETISQATTLNIRISLGHTNASQEILASAVTAGARMFTHLGNGCPRELDRHDNILWRVFETPGLTASLIPDQIHVSAPLFRLAHKAMASDSIFYTTDAMAAADATAGRYTLGAVEVEVGADQIVRQPGKSNFAGLALRPIDGIFRAAAMCDVSWQSVWKHFSEIPRRLMGFPAEEWKTGQPAQFCVLSLNERNGLRELKMP